MDEYQTPAEAVNEQVQKNFEAEPKQVPPPANLPASSPAVGPSAEIEPVDQQLAKAAEIPEQAKTVYQDPQVHQDSRPAVLPVLNSDYDPVPASQPVQQPIVIQQQQPQTSVGPTVDPASIELAKSTAAKLPVQSGMDYQVPGIESPSLQSASPGQVNSSEQHSNKAGEFDDSGIVSVLAELLNEFRGMRSDIKEIPKEPPKTVPPLGPKQPRLRRSTKSRTRRPNPELPSSIPARKPDTDSLQKPVVKESLTTAPVAKPQPVSVQTPAPPVARPTPRTAQPQSRPEVQQTNSGDAVMKAQSMGENLQKLLTMQQQQMGQVMSIIE